MKKSTIKNYLLILIVLMLSFAVMLTAFACTDTPTEEETPEDTSESTSSDTGLITNGDFSKTSSTTTYPSSPSNWSTYTVSGVTTDDDSVKGVISTGSDFKDHSSAWGDVNPFGKITEDKVLMIYNKTEAGNVYGYTNTFTTDSYGYYKVSAEIKVQNVPMGGATFRVYSDNGYVAFDAINNTDEFKTYTIYFEASTKKSETVTVLLSLGYAGDKVAGYAFFNNVKAEKIKKADYLAVKADAANKTGTLRYPNGEFDYYQYSSTENNYESPIAWEGKSTSGASTTYIDSGIISAENWDSAKTTLYGAAPGLPSGSKDAHILMISAKANSDGAYTQSAYYYQSKEVITIAPTHLYEISLYVKATVDQDQSVTDYSKKGARVVLYDTTNDKALVSSPVINTTRVVPDVPEKNDGWKKVVFRVLGDTYLMKSFSIQLWLGYKDSADYTQGKAYFDRLTVTELNESFVVDRTDPYADIEGAVNANYPTDVTAYAEYRFLDLGADSDTTTYPAFAAVKEGTLPTAEDWTFDTIDSVRANEKENLLKVISSEDLRDAEKTVNWKATYGLDANPLYAYTISPVLIVNNIYPTAYSMTQNSRFTATQNVCYRISVLIKTVDLEDGKNVTLKLMREKESEKEETEDKELHSFSVNTANYINDLTNHYAEYVFYIKGAPSSLYDEDDNKKLYLVISNGSGTAYDPSSYQKGAFLIADINCETLTYDEYSKVGTDDYSKKVELERKSSNSTSSSNWDFNGYNLSDTEVNADGSLKTTDKDGKVQLGTLNSSWTNNVTSSYGTTLISDANKTKTKALTIEKKEEDKPEDISAIDLDKITSITLDGKLKFTVSSSDFSKYFKIENGLISWTNDTVTQTLTGGSYSIVITTKKGNTVNVDLTKSAEGTDSAEVVFEEGDSASSASVTGKVTYLLEKESDYNTFFTIDKDKKTIKLASSTMIKGEKYNVTIRTDEISQNNLIAGIVNVQNQAQLSAVGLTKEAIYEKGIDKNGWSDVVSDSTKQMPVDFGAPNLLVITNYVNGKQISLNPASGYKKNTHSDISNTPALKTSSFSLDANKYYRLTFYARSLNGAKGEVYITNSSYNVDMPSYSVVATNGWMEYNFIIRTGLSTVSAYFEIYYGEKGNKEALYGGTLLFDSFSKTEIDKETFEELEKADSHYARFTTITFDKSITDSTAVAPTGLNGENGSSKNDDDNIVSGILYKETYDFTKLGIAKDETTTDDDGKETTTEVRDTTISFTKEGIFNRSDLGDYLLVINNIKKNYQQYTLTGSLESGSYYKFSVLVRTDKLTTGKKALVYVKADSESYEIEVDTNNQWKEYNFYLSNTKDSSVSADLCFRLGENSNEGKIRGLFLIDNVSLTPIEKEAYEAATAAADEVEKDSDGNIKTDENGNVITKTEAAKEFYASSRNILLKDDTSADDNGGSSSEEGGDGDDTEKKSLNTTLLWTYITAIVIAVALIAVIAIWLVRKYRRPKKSPVASKGASYDRNKKADGSESAEKTGSARDEYKD